MRTKKKIEVEVTEVKCDFCDASSIQNRRYAGGLATIEACHICHKDVCRKHRYTFWEDSGGDYDNNLTTCLQCKPIVEKIWKEEKEKEEVDDEYGSIYYNTIDRLKEKKNES